MVIQQFGFQQSKVIKFPIGNVRSSKQIPQLPLWYQSVMYTVSLKLTIPSPSSRQVWVQVAFHHLDDILANYRQELPGMERTTCSQEQATAVWMAAHEKVLCRRDCIPEILVNTALISRHCLRRLASRCGSSATRNPVHTCFWQLQLAQSSFSPLLSTGRSRDQTSA